MWSRSGSKEKDPRWNSARGVKRNSNQAAVGRLMLETDAAQRLEQKTLEHCRN